MRRAVRAISRRHALHRDRDLPRAEGPQLIRVRLDVEMHREALRVVGGREQFADDRVEGLGPVGE